MFRHPMTFRIKIFAALVTLVAVYSVTVSSVDSQQMEKRHTQLYRQRAFEFSFPKLGQAAPDIHLKTIDGQRVQLSAYLGKPLVLIKGSYTWPPIRRASAGLRRLHQQYADSGAAQIVIVYQKEPHAGQLAYRDIRQPENFEQRCELAARMKDEFEMPMDVLVDTMKDQSRQIFSDLPSPVYVMDAKGVVRAKFAWPDQEQIKLAVATLSADPPLSTATLGSGSSVISPPVPEQQRLPAPAVSIE